MTEARAITVKELADDMGVDPTAVATMAHQIADEDGPEAVYVDQEPDRPVRAEINVTFNVSGRIVSHGRLIEAMGMLVDSGVELTPSAADVIREHFDEWLTSVTTQ